MEPLAALWMAFLAGVYAPLGSPCIIPLYPGYLSFLAGRKDRKPVRGGALTLGFLVCTGVIVSMLLFGVIYITLIRVSLAEFLGIVSRIAFLILAIFSIGLILDLDLSRYIPAAKLPAGKNPFTDSLLLGMFFGVIILPCNAAAVVVLLALGTAVEGIAVNLATFLSFGAGMSLPLLVLSALSLSKSQEILGFLAKHRRVIHFTAGMLMLAVALYYLIVVFPMVPSGL